MTAPIQRGSEAARLADLTTVPAVRSVIVTDLGFYVGDGSTVRGRLPLVHELPGAASMVDDKLSAAIASIAARAVPAPRSATFAPVGTFALGMCARGTIVNSGFDVTVVRARCDTAPGGQSAVLQIIDGTTSLVLYTLTIPSDGVGAVDDTSDAASFRINDATQLKYNFTQIGSSTPGAGLEVLMSAGSGSVVSAGIGSVTSVAASTVGGASVTLTYQYSGTTPPSSFLIVTKAGSAAPASTTDGATMTVDGSQLTAQVTGLTALTHYSFAVYPVASDGTLGTAGTLTDVITAGADNTAPGPVTSTSYAVGATAATPKWTNPTDSDFHHCIVRLKINTLAPFAAIALGAQPSEGHPAATSTPTGTGAGTALAAGANTFTQSGLTASTNYVFGVWTVDAAGNINLTPVSIPLTTTAAVTGGQGLTLMVPSTFSKAWPSGATDPIQNSNMAAYVSANDKKQGLGAGFHGYANGVEGATAQENVGIMTDPLLGGGNKVMFLKMQRFKGWADSTSAPYKNNQGWFYINGTSPAQYTTDGTGWYGARIQNYEAPSQAWGGYDIEWWIANLDGTVASALGAHSKGITIMMPFPDANWPKREVDAVEIPSGFPQANIHFLTATGGNGQFNTTTTPSGLVLPNIFAPVKSTILLEPPPAGTGGVSSSGQAGGFGRLRVMHKQTGTAGGAVQTWMDTDKPYVGNNLNDDKVWRLLTQAQVGHIGIAVAYQASSVNIDSAGKATGANFSATTGTGANQRTGHMALIRSITQWAAA